MKVADILSTLLDINPSRKDLLDSEVVVIYKNKVKKIENLKASLKKIIIKVGDKNVR